MKNCQIPDIRALLADDAERASARRAEKGATGKTPTQYRIDQCLDTLNAFVGIDTPLPALQVMADGWLDAFTAFMQGTLSAATAAERADRLVACCRDAIKQRLLPNIPVRPGDTRRRELEQLPPLRRHRDIETLLTLFYHIQERLLSPKLGDSQRAALRQRGAAIGYALLAVLLCGIGYDGLVALRHDALDGNTLHLPHLGASVQLSDTILQFLQTLLPSDPDRQLLLFDDAQPMSAAKLQTMVDRELRTVALDFRAGFDTPMTQWLGTALAVAPTPLSVHDCRRLIDRLYGDKEPSTEANALVQGAFDTLNRSLRHLGYEWYCIRCIGEPDAPPLPADGDSKSRRAKDPRSRGEKMLQIITDDLRIHPVDTFAPKDAKVRTRSGRAVVVKDQFLDSLLFVRTNQAQIESINRYLISVKGGFIYATLVDLKLRFCTIDPKEVALLREFFDRKRDRKLGKEVAGSKKALLGVRAQIVAGMYDGYVGQICRVDVDEKKQIRTITLNFDAGAKHIQYTLDPACIELIK